MNDHDYDCQAEHLRALLPIHRQSGLCLEGRASLCNRARASPQWIVTYLLEASTRILSGPADARALGFPPIKGRNRGLALKADQRAVRAAAEFGAYHRIEWKKTGGPRLNAVAARAAAFGNFRDGSWIAGVSRSGL